MKAVRKKRIAILEVDRKDQKVFSRDSKKNLRIGELSRLAVEASGTGLVPVVYQALDHLHFPPLDEVDGIVIPGSIYTTDKESVQKHEWLKRLLDFIQKAYAAQRPLLGMCFGHQAIGAAFNVYSVKLDVGAEIGIRKVELTEQGHKAGPFKGFPHEFNAAFFHYYHVPELPEGAVQLATGDVCPLQAFRLGSLFAVQFHPDYDNQNIRELVELRLDVIREILGGQRVDVESDLNHNTQVLTNFLGIVAKK